MTTKNAFLIVLVLALGGLSLYLNRAWFRSPPIQIGDRSIQPRADWLAKRFKNSASNPVLFLLDRPLRLTSVQVVALSQVESNSQPHPMWRLATTSNSIPVKEFVYGVGIQGMKPAVKGAAAEPLQPGEKYRLLIEAGSKKAEHDFSPVAHAE